MNNKAGVPAVEMLMCPHSGLHFLQQSAICTLSFGVHGGAHVVQHAHYTCGVLQRRKGVGQLYCKRNSSQVLYVNVHAEKDTCKFVV